MVRLAEQLGVEERNGLLGVLADHEHQHDRRRTDVADQIEQPLEGVGIGQMDVVGDQQERSPGRGTQQFVTDAQDELWRPDVRGCGHGQSSQQYGRRTRLEQLTEDARCGHHPGPRGVCLHHPDSLVTGPGGELIREFRLARTGRSRNGHYLPRAVEGLVKQLLQ